MIKEIKRFINQNKSIRVTQDKWQGIKEIISGQLHIDGKRKYIKRYPIKPIKEKIPENFEHEFAITAITKNEGRYLQEWIEFHHLIGCEKFYIYDSGSTDNTQKILQEYQKKELAEIIQWPDMPPFLNKQLLAYTHAICANRTKVRWMAFIGIDEFIFSPTYEKITQFLKKYNDLPALIASWEMFGTSGHTKRPNGLVIENYTQKLDMNHCQNTYKPYLKSIVQPHRVTMVSNPHHFRTDARPTLGYDENKNPVMKGRIILNQKNLRIHHYYSKSKQDWQKRINRKGDVNYQFSKDETQNYIYKCNEIFKKIHRYQTEDITMHQFLPKLKKRMKNKV